MEYNQTTYTEYRNRIKDYFYASEEVMKLQDEASDTSLDMAALQMKQEEFERIAKRFHDECVGSFITFPIIEKSGKSYLKEKKIKEGKFECILTYVKHASCPVDAYLRLNDDFEEHSFYDVVNCADMVVSEEAYKDFIQVKEDIKKDIAALSIKLSSINDLIRDYEIVRRYQANKLKNKFFKDLDEESKTWFKYPDGSVEVPINVFKKGDTNNDN